MRCGRCTSIRAWPTSPPNMATTRCGWRSTGSGTIWPAKRLYVTGGLGPSADNEGFTSDYDLPNETAYAETCAAVGLVFWASRMLGMGPNAPLRRHDGARALQRRDLGPVARRLAVLLREPAGEPGRPQPLEMASLPVLPAQYRAHGRLDRQLFLRPVRTMRSPSTSMATAPPASTSAGTPVRLVQASRYPVGRRRSRSASSRTPGRVHPASAHSGLGRTAPLTVNGAAVDLAGGTATAMRRSGADGKAATASRSICDACERLYANPKVRQTSAAWRSARAADLLRRGDRQCRRARTLQPGRDAAIEAAERPICWAAW